MIKYLKGEDAHVYRACRELQLHPSLCMVYDGGEVIYGYEYRRVGTQPRGIMLKEIVEQPDYDYMNTSYRETLIKELGGTPVNLDDNTLDKEPPQRYYHGVRERIQRGLRILLPLPGHSYRSRR